MQPQRLSHLICLIIIALCATATVGEASLTQPTNTVEASIQKAIVEGDIQGLRLLLSDLSELSVSDQAIARRALASMETLGSKDSCVVLAKNYGLDWANKVHHALKTAADGPVKQALFKHYGSAEAIFLRVHQAINELRDLKDGLVEREVIVEGISVLVRMIVKGTSIRIATILKR